MSCRKVLGAVLLCCCAALGLALQDANNPRIIQVASEPDYPPYCIVNEAGEADGFAVELFEAAAQAVNLQPVFRVDLWHEIKQDLIDGRIDALPMVARTQERDKVLDFTFPYHTMRGALFVLDTTTDIQSLADVKHRRVAVMQGDSSHDFAREYEITDSLIATATFEEAFSGLHAGHHDAVVAQKVMGMQLVEILGYSDIHPLDIELIGFSQDFGFAVTEGDRELLSLLNEGLAIVIADGTYAQLHRKWWSPLEEHNLSWSRLIILLAPWLAGFVLCIALAAIIILRNKIRQRTAYLHKEIEEHKQVEQQLSLSENRFRILFESNPIPMFLWRYDGGRFTFVDFNAAIQKTIPKPLDELLNKPIRDIYPDRPDLVEKVVQCYNTHTEITFESHYVSRTQQKEYYVRFTLIRVSDELVLMMTQDITASRNTLNEIKSSEEKYRLLINQMDQGLAVHQGIFDDDGHMTDYRFLHCNRSFEQLTGLKAQNILGKTVREVLPHTENYWLEMYEKVVKSGEPVRYNNYSRELGKYFDITAYRNQPDQFAVIITDDSQKQQAIKELQESQRRLSLSLQSTHASVFEIDLQKGTTFFTPDLFTLVGYSQDQIPTQLEDCKSLYHPDEHEAFWQRLQSLKDGSSDQFSSENRIRTHHGQWRWIESTGKMIDDHMLVGISRDIHQRKTAEQHLIQSEEQFKFLSSATFEGIVVHKRGIIQDVNDSFCSMTGYTRDECLGQNLLSYIPSTKDRAKVMLNIVKRTARPYTIMARRKSGEFFTAELEAKDVLHKGKTVRIAAVRDVTEREHAARELAESEQRLNLVLQAADIGFWDYSLQDNKMLFSNHWLEIGGYAPGDVTPSLEGILILVHPDDHDRVTELIKAHIDGKTPLYEAEFRTRTKSGEWLWVLDRGRVMQFDDAGKPLRALGTRQDIHSRKLVEEQVHDLLEEKELLLREVHHRMKNNMATIETMLKIQSRNSELQQVRSALDEANSRMKSMRVLYDKLYRSDNFQDISIKRYFMHLVNEITSLFPQSSTLNIQLDFDEFTIPAKSIFHLGIILNELLTNAMKYAFPHITPQSTIRISATREATSAVIEIMDNGTGLPAGFAIEQSTGFGMQLVQMLTQQNNGTVELIPGAGAHWRLTFPLQS
jgi:PAS domain S-box-containing protein